MLTNHYRSWAVGVMALAIAGCSSGSGTPPRQPVPKSPTVQTTRMDKPLPAQPEQRVDSAVPPPVFDDQPLISQEAPETPAFLNAYRGVNNPRIVVFVNRTLEGHIVPVNPDAAVAKLEQTRKATEGVSVDRRQTESNDPWRNTTEKTDRFETKGPAEYRETSSLYLRPGQYDEMEAKSIDYEAMEQVLADFVRSDGRVQIVSPLTARQKLSDEQVKALESGRPTVLREIAQQLDGDVLIHVTARPTKVTGQGLQVRMIGEAINIRGGESLASAFVDVPPPLDKPQTVRFTRFLGRKLIDGMTKTWSFGPPPQARQPEAPATPVIPPPPSVTPQTDAPAPMPAPDRAPPPAAQPPVQPAMPPSTMPER